MTDRSREQADEYLLDLLAGKCRAQAVSTAASLGIGDQLASAAMTAEQLARRLDCDAAALERLLRFLAALDLCDAAEDGRFSLTSRGQSLRGEALGNLATFIGSAEQWDPWSRLRESLRDGRSIPFDLTFGTGLYEYMATDPDAARRYDAAVDAFTRHEARALCQAVDLSAARQVVDIGGGAGALLAEVLSHWPQLLGILFDLPHVVERARAELEERHPGRVEVIGASFRDTLPAGADVYLLKHILHNWSDEQAHDLLCRCAGAMAENGRLLVIEAVLAPDNRPDTARMLDLEMLVLTGGRERRKPELRRLFRDTGLALGRVEPLSRTSWLLEASRRT